MATLVYQCPVCGTAHKIADSLFGSRVECRDCGCPFKAAIPVAYPVEGGLAETIPESHHIIAGEGERKDTILEVHPSKVRQAPWTFLGLLLLLAAGIAGIVCGLVLAAGLLGIVLWVAGLVLVVFSISYFGLLWISSHLTTLTITNQRTILTQGLITQKSVEVEHDDVSNMNIEQGLLDRLLNVGQISVSSAGQDGLEIVAKGIPDPERVISVIRDMQ